MPQYMRFFETVLEHQIFVGENGEGWPVGHDHTLVHDDCPRAEFDDKLQVVCSDDLRGLDGPEKGFEQSFPSGVEAPGRLIQGQDFRLAGQEAR